jgi:hypothetical protein
MEHVVYRLFYEADRNMGSFVDMLPSCEETKAFVTRHESEHEVVSLWTYEITEEDEYDFRRCPVAAHIVS